MSFVIFFFFKQKTAYEIKECDWSSDVCSSDLIKTLQEFDQDARSELTKERDDMVRDILKEMNDVIRGYGEKNGYAIILNDRVLLYGQKTMDLTDDIIKLLNDSYKK